MSFIKRRETSSTKFSPYYSNKYYLQNFGIPNERNVLRFFDGKKCLSIRQCGFLPGRSITLQLLNVLEKQTEVLDNGTHFYAVYSDLMKAFDTVPHQRLLRVLGFYNTLKNLEENNELM